MTIREWIGWALYVIGSLMAADAVNTAQGAIAAQGTLASSIVVAGIGILGFQARNSSNSTRSQ